MRAVLPALLLLPVGVADAAAPAVDSSSSIATNSTNQVTVSHTTAGANRLMLVGIGWDIQGTPDVTGVTYNGASLSFVGGHTSGSEVRTEIWQLVAPSVGTADVVVSFDANVVKGVVVGVMTFTGVDEGTPLGTYAGNSGSGSTASVNVTSDTDELVFATVCNETQNMTVGGGQTEYWNHDTGNAQGAGCTEPGAASVTVSWTLSSDAYVLSAVPIKPGGAAISSAANQSFATGDPATAISPITVTEGGSPAITAVNDLRIRIPTGFGMTWNTADTTATIGGTAAGKVSSTVSYEDSGRTLVLDVTSGFSAGQTLTVSDLDFTDFLSVSAADNLELEIGNDDIITAFDDKTITIGGAVVNYRSIGTGGVIYSTGTASTTAGSPTVTFAGATLASNVGTGDKITIDSGGSTLFSDDFSDDSLTGWTSLWTDTPSETGGVLVASSSSDEVHLAIDAGSAWTDYTVTCDIRADDDDDMGISFRVQDGSNFYLLRQRFGNSGPSNWDLFLEKHVAGSSPDIAPSIDNQGSAPGQVDSEGVWYTLKVEVSGTSIKCYVDDVLKFDVTDATYSDGTVGVWCESQAGRWDNMSVTSAGGADYHVFSRDSDTQVTLQSSAASTQTNQSYSVERAYGTLQAWEDARGGDLVADTRREVGMCYNDGAFGDRVTISGSTTDASYYMRLTVPAGERHDGTPDSGARIDAGGGWTGQNAIDVEDEYTRIEWLEITGVTDAGDGIYFSNSPAADNGLASGVFVHGFWQNGNAAFRVAAPGVTVRNCFATGGTTYGVLVASTGEVMVENCTLWGSSGGGYGVYGASSSTVSVRNTISVDHGTLDMYIETGGGATINYFGYNMFSTYGGGFDPNSYAGYNQWPPSNLDHLFVDRSAGDLHLELSGNRAANLGLDLSADFGNDIDGQARSGDWDMGADEARPGFGPSTPKVMVWQEIER